MRSRIVVLLFLLALLLLSAYSCGNDPCGKCWPISTAQSTGTIRCWSSGILIYHNDIYHNGGVLCSVEGKEIDIGWINRFCIIESNQADVWDPPTATER